MLIVACNPNVVPESRLQVLAAGTPGAGCRAHPPAQGHRRAPPADRRRLQRAPRPAVAGHLPPGVYNQKGHLLASNHSLFCFISYATPDAPKCATHSNKNPCSHAYDGLPVELCRTGDPYETQSFTGVGLYVRHPPRASPGRGGGRQRPLRRRRPWGPCRACRRFPPRQAPASPGSARR